MRQSHSMSRRTVQSIIICGLLAAPSVHAATTGWNQTDAGTYNYTAAANWVGGTINDTFDSSLTLAGSQLLTFSANRTTVGSMAYSYDGAFDLSLKSDSATLRSLSVSGDLVFRPQSGGRSLTFGDAASPLNLVVPGATLRTFDIAAGQTVTCNNVLNISGAVGGLNVGAAIGSPNSAGTLVLNGANSVYNGLMLNLNAGTVVVGNTNAFSSSSSGRVILLHGGAFDLQTDTTVNPWTLRADGATTIRSNRATAGAGISQGLGDLQLIGGQVTLEPGNKVTSGTAAFTFSKLTLNPGASSFTMNDSASALLGVTFSGPTRQVGATLDLTLPAAGTMKINTTTIRTVFGNSVTVGGVTWPSLTREGTTNSYIVGALPDSSYSANTATSFTANTNVDMRTGDTTLGATAVTVNSLRFNSAAARTLTVGAGGLTLRGDGLLGGGGILVTPNVGANLTTITGSTLRGPAVASTDLVVIQNNTAGDMLIASSISDNTTYATGLTKAGPGTLLISGDNTYTGQTTVSGGTLKLAAANRIADASALLLAGGTLDTAGFSETLASISLNQSSRIDLGTGNSSILSFTALGGTFDTSRSITILNWAVGDQLFIGNSASLTAAQLAAISFDAAPGQTGAIAAVQLSTGEIQPVVIPEPATVAISMLGISALLIRRRRTANGPRL